MCMENYCRKINRLFFLIIILIAIAYGDEITGCQLYRQYNWNFYSAEKRMLSMFLIIQN